MTEQKAFIPKSSDNNIQVPGMALRSNAGLPTHKKKAIFFIDANNWYPNVKRYYNPSEIDIIKVVKFLSEVKNYEVKEIRFYASIPSIEDGESVYYNHIAYLESLEKQGVHVVRRKLQNLSNKEMNYTHNINDRVRASVNPTNRIIAKRARDSSGRILLYFLEESCKFINLSFNDFKRRLGWRI